MKIDRIDHLLLTAADIERTCGFHGEVHGEVLGMEAVVFGGQKINLHQSGPEFEPKAAYPTPGSADLLRLVTHLRSARTGMI